MSSAILYVAIVAIWACVLIPRWLRRDSVRGAAFIATGGSAVPGEAGRTDIGGMEEPTGDIDGVGGTESVATPIDAGGLQRPAPEPMTAEESRRRMLAARRRLLIMLVVLEAAAVALAVVGLAAVWVVAPPSVMLAGYLLLLREAAHADAEQAQREADALAGARARARQRAQAARPVTTPATSAQVAPAWAATMAAAPVPADYENSGPGRDFAPGLAGKYTPSYADPNPASDDYGTYDEPRLRAVGD
jgi:hypothetical protein